MHAGSYRRQLPSTKRNNTMLVPVVVIPAQRGRKSPGVSGERLDHPWDRIATTRVKHRERKLSGLEIQESELDAIGIPHQDVDMPGGGRASVGEYEVVP